MITQAGMMANGLGLFIRQLITGKGWSQRQAAAELGIPFTTLNNIIHGRNEPDVATLRKLASSFKVTMGRLIQAMGDDPEGTLLPRPLRSLSPETLRYIDEMDEEEFAEFLEAWEKIKGRRR
jgi:transcriptional regulator with XRE-family HTH domain